MTDHADGCYSWGPQHYECARRRIAELAGEMIVLEAKREAEHMAHSCTIAEEHESRTAFQERIAALEGFLRRLLCIEATCDDCGGDITLCRSEQPSCPIREAREFLKGEKHAD